MRNRCRSVFDVMNNLLAITSHSARHCYLALMKDTMHSTCWELFN